MPVITLPDGSRREFDHPVTGRPLDFESALPVDIGALLAVLARDVAQE